MKKKPIYFLLSFAVFVFAIYTVLPHIVAKYHSYKSFKDLNLEVKNLKYENDHIEYVEGGEGETLVFVHGFQSTKKNKWAIGFITVIILGLPRELYYELFLNISEMVNIGIMKDRLLDLAEGFQYKEFQVSGTHMAARAERLPFLLNSFFESPIVGGGPSTGHVFWLDTLSKFGIIGIFPWILILNFYFRKTIKLIHNPQISFYYLITIFQFIVLGLMKGSGGKQIMIILIFIIPGFLLLNVVERHENST